MKNYKFILFDADNTLFDFDASEKNAITKLFNNHGVPLSYVPEYSEVNKSLWEALERGEIARSRLKTMRFEIIFEKAGVKPVSFVNVAAEYEKYLSEQAILYDGALDICAKIRNLGKKIFIITNGNKNVQKSRFYACGLEKFVDGIFISENVGYAKPAKEFFDFVIEKTGAKREECLIIGDSYGSDILGGINSGIDTCHYNPKNLPNTKNYYPTYTVNSFSDILHIIGG